MSRNAVAWCVAIAAAPIVLLLTLSRGDDSEILTISAAASLREVCSDIQEIYRSEYPNRRMVLNIAGSGALANQILLGAPVDVFLSASQDHIARLEKAESIEPETAVVLATNTVLLIQPIDASFKLHSFGGLLDPKVEKLAIGNPQTVPAGRYARETLMSQGIMEAISGKIVLAEHVRQVLDYVVRGEADAGIVYQTDFELVKDRIRIVAAAPSGSHSPVVYVGALVSGTSKRRQAQQFLRFFNSRRGKESLERRGFQALEK